MVIFDPKQEQSNDYLDNKKTHCVPVSFLFSKLRMGCSSFVTYCIMKIDKIGVKQMEVCFEKDIVKLKELEFEID